MTADQIPSVTDRMKPVAVGAPVIAVRFLSDATAVFVAGEEALMLVPHGGEASRVDVHGGGILAVASDGTRVVTGGDDGRIVETSAARASTTAATDPKRRWIDHVAIAPDGTIAWSAGKEVFVQGGKVQGAKVQGARKDAARKDAAPRTTAAPSTVGGLAFAPKGLRLAISHYNGVTLWYPNATEVPPARLQEWKGSHLDVGFSPDGRHVVTAMQEPALHGWRIADGKHMRMTGYSTKVRSMAFTAGGSFLATSGAPQLVVWPFHGEDGPLGREPTLLAPGDTKVSTVACHPSLDVVATGYDDGLILLVRLGDGGEILARRPGGSPVTGLAWNSSGALLAFGTEDGDAGIVDLS